jgi:hypothetical protein
MHRGLRCTGPYLGNERTPRTFRMVKRETKRRRDQSLAADLGNNNTTLRQTIYFCDFSISEISILRISIFTFFRDRPARPPGAETEPVCLARPPVHRSARRRPAPLSVGKQSRRAEHGEEREDDAQRQPNLPL